MQQTILYHTIKQWCQTINLNLNCGSSKAVAMRILGFRKFRSNMNPHTYAEYKYYEYVKLTSQGCSMGKIMLLVNQNTGNTWRLGKYEYF